VCGLHLYSGFRNSDPINQQGFRIQTTTTYYSLADEELDLSGKRCNVGVILQF
jgi:hypothetical protein